MRSLESRTSMSPAEMDSNLEGPLSRTVRGGDQEVGSAPIRHQLAHEQHDQVAYPTLVALIRSGPEHRDALSERWNSLDLFAKGHELLDRVTNLARPQLQNRFLYE